MIVSYSFVHFYSFITKREPLWKTRHDFLNNRTIS